MVMNYNARKWGKREPQSDNTFLMYLLYLSLTNILACDIRSLHKVVQPKMICILGYGSTNPMDFLDGENNEEEFGMTLHEFGARNARRSCPFPSGKSSVQRIVTFFA